MNSVFHDSVNAIEYTKTFVARKIYRVVGVFGALLVIMVLCTVIGFINFISKGIAQLDPEYQLKGAGSWAGESSDGLAVIGSKSKVFHSFADSKSHLASQQVYPDSKNRVDKSGTADNLVSVGNAVAALGHRNLSKIIDDLKHAQGAAALRYLNELWRRAGDLQAPDDALTALQQVSLTGDEYLASRAASALKDLMQLRARLEAENTQSAFSQIGKRQV